MKKIVIAGFGSAGYSALSTLKRIGCRDEIVVVDRKRKDLLHPCGLPYALEGRVFEEKLCQDIGLERMGVKIIRAELSGIDPDAKTLLLESSESPRIEYEELLITTGASPVIPPIDGIREFLGKGVFTLASIDDLDSIKAFLPKVRSALVIGAGAIGLEAAVALKTHCESVRVIEMKDQVLPGILDPDMAALAAETLVGQGIALSLSLSVERILGDPVVKGVCASGTDFTGDIVILAAGFRPNSGLAEKSGITTDRLGIVTDGFLRASADHVYAAGDCAVTRSVIDGKPIAAKLATSSYKQGSLAAYNIMGIAREYRGSAGTFVSKIGELEIAGTGFTTFSAKERGFDPVISKISSHICPEYFDSNEEIVIKVVADRSNGKILGAQSIGRSGAASRINILSAAIEFNLTLEDLERLEMAYCPAVSEVYDPLLRTIDGALRRIKR